MLLPPPGLLLTVSETGMSFPWTSMRSTVRAVLSLLPPGAEPTTISTFFCGDQVWAHTADAASASAAPSAAKLIFICSPRRCGSSQFLELRRFHDFRILVDLQTDEFRERLGRTAHRSEEHTSELQSQSNLV